MKKNRCILLSYLIFISVIAGPYLISQENTPLERWNYNSARIMPKGKWESGIFQPFRIGISDRIEIRANALLLPIFPNAGIRMNLGRWGSFELASEHSLSIPSVFLNFVSFKGIGGLISPQYNFGFMASLNNSVIISKPIGTGSLFCASAGFSFAMRARKPDYNSTIDIPYIYQRMAHWYEGSSVKSQASFTGTILKDLWYEEGIRLYLITRPNHNFFIENSGSIMWSAKGSLRIRAGYILSWGRYPFGNLWQMWPTFDFIFGSRYLARGGEKEKVR